MCCEGVPSVLWGGSDEERGEEEAGGGGKGEDEEGRVWVGLSGSARPVRLPQGSSYELRAFAHFPDHLPLLLSPEHNGEKMRS